MATKKQTKAERIFNDTYRESRIHIKRWGTERGMCWSGLIDSKEESYSTRTLNAIDKLIDAEMRKIEDFEKFTAKHPSDDPEHDLDLLKSYELRKQALTMTRNTVEGVREREREFAESLKAL